MSGLLVLVPLFMTPFSQDSFLLPKHIMTELYLLIFAFFLFLNFVKKGTFSIRIILFDVFIYLFLGYFALRVVFSPNNYEGLWAFRHILICFFVFFLFSKITKDFRDISFLTHALLLGSFFVCLFGWSQFLGWDVLAWRPHANPNHVFSTLGNRQFLSGFLLLVFPLSLFHTTNAPNRSRKNVFYMFLSVLILCTIFLTRSFSGMVLSLAIILTAFVCPRRIYSHKFFLAVLMGGALFFFAFFINDLGALVHKQFSFGQRSLYFKMAFYLFCLSPLWGHGLGGFSALYSGAKGHVLTTPASSPGVVSVDWFHPHVESDVLESLVEWGLVGVIVFFVLVLCYCQKVFLLIRHQNDRHKPLTLGILAGLGAVGLYSLGHFPFRLTATSVPFFAMAGMLASQFNARVVRISWGQRASSTKMLMVEAGSLLLVFLVIWCAKPFAADMAYKKAFASMKERDYSQAVLRYTFAQSMDPKRSELDFRLGEAFFYLKDYAQAIQHTQQALDRRVRKERYYLLGECYRKTRNYPLAYQAYQQALAIDPYYREALFQIASLSIDLNRMNQGQEYLQRFLSVYEDPRAYFNLGVLFAKSGDKQKALSLLRSRLR